MPFLALWELDCPHEQESPVAGQSLVLLVQEQALVVEVLLLLSVDMKGGLEAQFWYKLSTVSWEPLMRE